MKRAAIALTALVLGLAACGAESDTPRGEGDRSGAGAGTEAPETQGDAPTPGGAASVRMVGIQYEPRELTVKAGTTVTFTNEDEAPHDVDATSGSDFKSDLVQKGGTIELPAEEPGTIEFVCSVHPNMTGTLTVTE
jgi:plastocyanin